MLAGFWDTKNLPKLTLTTMNKFDMMIVFSSTYSKQYKK